MSPIITTMSAPAGRGRRVKLPNASGASASYGAGPNAPAWSGKTVYTDERFASDLPESPSAANAAGFRLTNGFGNNAPDGNRISYPTESTPLGSKRVMRMAFRGQTESLAALNATTTPWAFNPFSYWNAAIWITGTWSGTLTFETSSNGGSSWNATTLTAIATSGNSNTTGASTTVNGLWAVDTGTGDQLVRVRASSWTSGTASVRVGVRGGGSPANFAGGTFTGRPTRIYQRVIWRFSANWSDGGNTGTKFFFFSQDSGNNHYVAGLGDFAGLQGSASVNYNGTGNPSTFGDWLDCEQVITSGTANGSNGTIQLWVNGVQVVNASSVPMFAAATTPGFDSLFFDPTYGGGERPPPANQYIDYAYMYRESAP